MNTSLVKNVLAFSDILRYFQDAKGAPLGAHSISHPEYISSQIARNRLINRPAAAVPLRFHDLPRNDAPAASGPCSE